MELGDRNGYLSRNLAEDEVDTAPGGSGYHTFSHPGSRMSVNTISNAAGKKASTPILDFRFLFTPRLTSHSFESFDWLTDGEAPESDLDQAGALMTPRTTVNGSGKKQLH